ncbi:MAG: carboxypeptidase regulatory-like domain-containing protein [Deltaproteobacteria bacterium]|nr:carboxypeptidase regulatory-like domain-containing protein [Deltaproteobacteria bacterium]MDQ3300478.1 carboxypeptidase-like regulatory domain-containing protein [Myxococcota bacterium]
MRAALLLSFGFAIAACGGSNRGQSVCDNVVPPPAACMTTCDATPGAPSTCPAGYHCTEDGTCDARCSQGGTECGDGYRCTPEGRCVGDDECVGLECKITDCEKQGKPLTTISGTVYAPNGTLPLYGIDVFVPNVTLGAPQDGAICDRCSSSLPGYPLSLTKSDEAGKFTMTNVPSGTNIPVVISTGKWRRTVMLPQVTECTDNALPATETRLPKNKSEGYMPKIAISTGSADALECLVRKLGIDDKEITTDAQGGMLNLYADTGAGGGQGANKFKGGFPGGSGNFSDSKTLWNDVAKLKTYDIVILSCEGAQHPETKSQAAMDAIKAYADFGGRVFLSHWHNVWIEGSTQGGGNQRPAVWSGPDGIATWNNSGTTFTTPPDTIDEINNPKGTPFATWMLNVMGSPTRGVIPIESNTGKQTCTGINNGRAERWVYWQQGGMQYPQMFQFTTPNETTPDNRCGKVVFSDMHVSGDSDSTPSTPFPDSCASSALTPQEKALAFMFFDIASCVSPPLL